MIEVIEKRTNEGTRYLVSENGSVRNVQTRHLIAENECIPPMSVFYDSEWSLLIPPSAYLLEEHQYSPSNTKLIAINALKLLYSFSQILGYPPEDFSRAQCLAFVQFLRGSIGESARYSFKNVTTRSESTISSYLNTVRSFMRYLGKDDSPFLKKKITRNLVSSSDGEQNAYSLSVRINQPLSAPMDVSIKEYLRLKETIGDKPGMPDGVIVELMFEYGLRIGEVLGLTFEDMGTKINRKGKKVYFLLLRNRVSDRPDQMARTVTFKPRTREEYSSKGYSKKDIGYQYVEISESTYFKIDEYIQIAHTALSSEKRYLNRADGIAIDDNHYIFISSRGTPLSANLWGKRLRIHFKNANLPVDEGTRQTNLSHRLRHGYAMTLARTLKADSYSQMVMMRHSSLRSIEPYLLPSDEEIHEMYELVMGSFQRELLSEVENAR